MFRLPTVFVHFNIFRFDYFNTCESWPVWGMKEIYPAFFCNFSCFGFSVFGSQVCLSAMDTFNIGSNKCIPKSWIDFWDWNSDNWQFFCWAACFLVCYCCGKLFFFWISSFGSKLQNYLLEFWSRLLWLVVSVYIIGNILAVWECLPDKQ